MITSLRTNFIKYMAMKKCKLFLICGALLPFCACSSQLTVDNSTVREFNVEKFFGKWYEIARFDHSFERDMTNCTATYIQNYDGKIAVVNRGVKNGKIEESRGKAKKTKTTGLLRVSFFGPFYSNYRVMMISPEYTYALIGSDSDDYLWILSRTPTLPSEDLKKILTEAKLRGYDTSKLIWVEQDTLKNT